MTATTDILTGTVKGPGLLPHEYLFITRDNSRTRIGEFVCYEAQVSGERRQIIGTISSRRLVRNYERRIISDGTILSAGLACCYTLTKRTC